MAWLGETAHWLGLVPLAWLAIRRSRNPAHWWLAAVFGISWLADTLAHVMPWQVVSLAYPVSQAALVGVIVRPKDEAHAIIAVLLVVGLAAVWGLPHPDVLLTTVAWGLIVRSAWPMPIGPLRGSLLMTFGVGLIGWYGFVAWPGWTSWSIYQGTRVLGTGLFCRATKGA